MSEADPQPVRLPQLWEFPDSDYLVEAYILDPFHEDFDVEPAYSKAFLLNERIKVTKESQHGWSDGIGARFDFLDNEIRNIDVMMDKWGVYHHTSGHVAGDCSCTVCARVECYLSQMKVEDEVSEQATKVKSLATAVIGFLVPKQV